MIPVLPFLLAAPSRAGYVEARLDAIDRYEVRISSELAQARGLLENLQEISLEPHRGDPRADLALMRLDAAESYFQAGLRTMRDEVKRGTAAPEGWRPFGDEVEEARKLAGEREPALGKILEATPIELQPLPGLALAQVRGDDRIELRGYFAVNPVPAEWLAAVLAHEAAHIRQYRKSVSEKKKHVYSLADELEAREIEAKLWLALGAPEAKDWDGNLKLGAKAYQAGPAEFKKYVELKFKQEPDWLWIEPAVAAPPRPATPALGELVARAKSEGAADAEDLARKAKAIVELVAEIEKNSATAASDRLKNARLLIEDFPELAAPQRSIVNTDRMETNALSPEARPAALWLFFQAVHPALAELDRAREALGRRKLAADERRELENDLGFREKSPKAAFERGEALAKLKAVEGGEALAPAFSSATVVLVGMPDARLAELHPDWILVPGERAYRDGDAAAAFAQAVHVLAERAGKSESEAVELSERALAAWGPKDASVPLGFAAEFEALDEGGRPLLELYLKSRRD